MEKIKWFPLDQIREMKTENNNQDLYKIQDMIRQLDSLNEKCTQNMNRLNSMMLELKGIVAMVRPKVKNTGWYGDEIEGKIVSKEGQPLEIELNLIKRVE